MNALEQHLEHALRTETRRQFFGHGVRGLGLAALGSLLATTSTSAAPNSSALGGLPQLPHFAPKAKRAIYLFMSGAPSQHDLYDYKPEMGKWFDKDLPDSVRMGQRLTTMTSRQKRFPIAPSIYEFQKHGTGDGAWISELLPYTARMVDEWFGGFLWMRTVHEDGSYGWLFMRVVRADMDGWRRFKIDGGPKG